MLEIIDGQIRERTDELSMLILDDSALGPDQRFVYQARALENLAGGRLNSGMLLGADVKREIEATIPVQLALGESVIAAVYDTQPATKLINERLDRIDHWEPPAPDA
jgi:hypothetical protein